MNCSQTLWPLRTPVPSRWRVWVSCFVLWAFSASAPSQCWLITVERWDCGLSEKLRNIQIDIWHSIHSLLSSSANFSWCRWHARSWGKGGFPCCWGPLCMPSLWLEKMRLKSRSPCRRWACREWDPCWLCRSRRTSEKAPGMTESKKSLKGCFKRHFLIFTQCS